MRQAVIIGCARLSLCVGVLALPALARAGNDVIDNYLAEERQAMGLSPSPRVDMLDSFRVSPPPINVQPYEPLIEEPRHSMRPPWLQPADRLAPMTQEESRRMFCIAPDDCFFDQRR